LIPKVAFVIYPVLYIVVPRANDTSTR
jgi:hypothetical protein